MVKDARLACDKFQGSSFFILGDMLKTRIGSHAWLRTRVLLVKNVNVHQFYIR